jgi:hypothetical protein
MIVSEGLRVIVRAKLSAGQLPSERFPSVWSGPGHGELCAACGEKVTPENLLLEGFYADLRPVPFHVQCFYAWDTERATPEKGAG